MDIKDIFKNDYIVSAAYESSTKLASMIDGLKTSARKILYTCLDENITSKKVGQLTARTSDKTNYIHGEMSLTGVTVGMAQRFTGSNNIPLLQTDGSFGTRLIPEAAAARYIFTGIEKYLRKIFKPEDDNILEEQYFEGDKIEPKYYLPIIPMLLVNGSDGLAIGFAQYILPRNPSDLIKYINQKLIGRNSNNKLLPYWKGFKGKVEETTPGIYTVYGCIDVQKGKGIISEIPIGISYKKYIDILDTLCEKGILNNYSDKCDTNKDEILFEVKFNANYYQKIINKEVDVYEDLKLKTSETENYTCLGPDGAVKVYKNVYEIIDEYIKIRLEGYEKRKNYLLNKFKYDLNIAVSKYMFIKGVIEETIIIKNQSLEKIYKQLESAERIVKDNNDSFDYLLRMQMSSMTKEKLSQLKEDIKKLKNQLDELKSKTIEQLWKDDLNDIDFL